MNIVISEDWTQAALDQRKAMANIPKAVRWILQDWSGETVKFIKEGLAGEYLNRRTGHLANSVGRRIDRRGEVAVATVGTNVQGRGRDVPYARIQDEGGWIVPKKAKALTIPLPGIKGRVANFGTFGRGGNLFVLRPRGGGNALICMKTGKGKVKPLFVLSKSVKIPATYWFSKPWAFMVKEFRDRMEPDQVFTTAARMNAAAEEKES